MSWQPIETAPMDGTVILLSDGERFTAGAREFRIESETKCRGYENGQITSRFLERVPNPNAGQRTEWWGLFGCSAWNRETNVEDYNGSVWFEPKYWMPAPKKVEPLQR